MIEKKLFLKCVIIIINFIMLIQVSQAIPNITLTQGTFSQNLNITVNGIGFGTKTMVAPLIFETFDNYSAGQSLNTLSTSGSPITFYPQSPVGFPNPADVSINPLSRPGKSAHIIYIRANCTGQYGGHFWNSLPALANARYIMVDAWVYALVDPNWVACDGTQGPQFKIFHLGNGNEGGEPPAGIPFTSVTLAQQMFTTSTVNLWSNSLQEFFPYKSGTNNATIYGSSHYGSPVIQNDGAWSHLRFFIDVGEFNVSAPPYTGSTKLYKGNVLVASAPVQWYQTNWTGRFNSFDFGAFMANTLTTHADVYWDNIYVDNSWARIEIGNNINYSQSTHTEIQIPHTTWNNTQIQFTANKGSFGYEQLYLFVIDSNGTASVGYPITFSDVPQPPTITSVSDNTLVHGQNITINGSGFGIKNPVSPALWEDFNEENANDGDLITSILTNWRASATGGTPAAFDNEFRYGNRGYSSMVIQPNPDDGSGLNSNLLCCSPSLWSVGPGEKIFTSMKFRFNGSNTWTNECPQQYKVFGVGHSNNGQFDYPNVPFIYQGMGLQLYAYHENGMTDDNVNPIYGHFQDTIHSNSWISVAHELKLPSGAGMNDGTARGWAFVDGIKDYRARSGYGLWDTEAGESQEFDSAWFRHYIPTPAVGCNPVYALNDDDVYIDTTWARIEIGNNIVYNDSTQREMQIPHTTWNNNQIQFTANKGSFADGEQLYLFVVDENGNASTGYPITFSDVPQLPTINSVSNNTLTHGQNITINGSGFGIKNPVAPVTWATFDEGISSIGSDVPAGAGTPHNWIYRVAPPRYTNTWSHNGGVAVSNEVQYTTGSSWAELDKRTTPDTGVEEMYMTLWTYNTAGPMSTGEGKGPRMGATTASGGSNNGPYSAIGTHDFDAAQLVQSVIYGRPTGGAGSIPVWGVPTTRPARPWYSPAEPVSVTYLSPGYTNIFNEPQRLEGYVKLSTPGVADGSMYASRMSTSGIQTINQTIMNRLAGSNYKLNTWLVMNGAANTNGAATPTIFEGVPYTRTDQLNWGYPYDYFMDDVYLDTTRARVEIGNSYIFSNCTHREIQLPHTTWNNTQIQFTANKGSFADGEQLYLFVINANGTVSTGYPVTFSSEPTANLLFFEGFEENDWQQYFSGGAPDAYATRVQNAPFAGSWSLRSNLRGTLAEPYIDPITNLPGDKNLQLECRFGGLLENTPNQVFVRYYLRIDNSYWPGLQAKKEYLADDTIDLGAYFTSLRWIPGPDYMTLSGNSATYDMTGWPGRGYFYIDGETPVSLQPNGEWHKFEYFFNYTDNTLQLWMDDVRLVTAGPDATNYPIGGYYPLNPAFHLRGFQFLYGQDGYDWSQTSPGTNPVGYPGGWQIDNLEVWDGLPPGFGGNINLYCGDSICNNGETCSTCSQDCGVCSTCPSHDANIDNIIGASEITTALTDWFSGNLSLNELIQLMGYFKEGACA